EGHIVTSSARPWPISPIQGITRAKESFRHKKLPQHGGPAAMPRGGDHSRNSNRYSGPVLCINSHRHRHHLCPSARGCFFPAMERGALRGAPPTRELFSQQAFSDRQDREEPWRREHAPWEGEEEKEEDGARSDRDEAARVETWRGGTAAVNRPPRGAWGEGMDRDEEVGREEEFRGQ
ncbi:unnamed protein product, partial [Ectocarpus sp. 13 AM-2016]